MNEEIIQETVESLQSDIGQSDVPNNVYGDSDTATTDTISTGITDTETDASDTSPNVWTSDNSDVSDSVSSGDIGSLAEVDTETLVAIQENTSQILENVSTSTSLLVLIFMFLLFEWTEKKLKVTVNKFTDKRRH